MKRVNLREFPKFWIDYRNQVIDLIQDVDLSEGQKVIKSWYSGSENLIKDWYGFTVKIDWAGSLGEVFMSDQDYTLFVLKYG